MTHTNTEGLSDELLAKMIARQTLERDQYMSGTFLFVRHDERVKAFTELLSRRAANSAGGVEMKAYLHEPTGNVLSAKDHAILLPKWQRQFAADMTAAEIAADFTPLYTHPSSPVSAEVTDADVERAAKAIAENHWSVDSDFVKAVHVARTWQYHADDARAALAAINGGRDNG